MGAGIYPWEFCISMHFSMLGELKDHKMRRGLVVSEMAATGFEQKKQHWNLGKYAKVMVDNSWEIGYFQCLMSFPKTKNRQQRTV